MSKCEAHLEDDDVRLIRELIEERERLQEEIKRLNAQVRELKTASLAEKFEVSKNVILGISSGRNYLNVV